MLRKSAHFMFYSSTIQKPAPDMLSSGLEQARSYQYGVQKA